MEFEDFFDIYNVAHLAAYKHLTQVGYWPKGFIPDNCSCQHLSIITLQSKMADAYVKLGMEGKIFGMPPHDELPLTKI
jgi:hypothetical protein